MYVGQSKDIYTRWAEHKNCARANVRQTDLYKAMREFGIDNFEFEIIEECRLEELNERE